ncbi:MAG TPA: NAD(P)-dependent oxidoreductase, partial [Kiloniellaceae bacterium]
PLAELAADGVEAARSTPDLVARCDIVFLSLPGEKEVRQICLGADGLIEHARSGQTVVDTSTAPVTLAQELGRRFAEKGVDFADAPVARTRQAAVDGTLAITVGGDAAVLERIRPHLACMSNEITHCGGHGAGEAVKLLNNMVVSLTTVALAEAITVARQSGAVSDEVLFEALSKGSADSFVLRSHGMKSLLPDDHPLRAFPITYMIKDLSYALRLAEGAGLHLRSANVAKALLERAVELGHGEKYHTAVVKAVEAKD